MMVPVVQHILVQVAHAIQVQEALSTQALVVLHMMAPEAPDILAREVRHMMVLAALHTMVQEGLVTQAPVDRVIPAQEAPAKIARVYAGRELSIHSAQPERGYNAVLFVSFPCRARLALR